MSVHTHTHTYTQSHSMQISNYQKASPKGNHHSSAGPLASSSRKSPCVGWQGCYLYLLLTLSKLAKPLFLASSSVWRLSKRGPAT